jgi:hypothetical protein
MPRRGQKEAGDSTALSFGSEDLAAFLTFARDEVGISDQEELFQVFKLFCQDVGAVGIGVAARSAQLTLAMGERLLKLHMKDEGETQKARAIAEALSKKFHHHGYPVGRREARDMGLKIADPPVDVEDLMWRIWVDIREELAIREPFSPMSLVSRDPKAAPLFAPAPHINMPANLPPQLAQQVIQAVLQQVEVVPVPPSPYSVVNALLESLRLATRFVTEGRVFSMRLPDLQIKLQTVQERGSWRTLEIPSSGEEPTS